MKKFLVNTIWAVGGIALALFCLSACTRELDVQQAYDFSLEVMPVQNSIAKGETAEIRCSLKRSGRFANTQYTIRYFQPDGKGCLKMDDGTVFKPNDRYPLTRDTFRLYYTIVYQRNHFLKLTFTTRLNRFPLMKYRAQQTHHRL